jgi:hypothetical protein
VERQARLADPADPGERDDPIWPHCLDHCGDVALAADVID